MHKAAPKRHPGPPEAPGAAEEFRQATQSSPVRPVNTEMAEAALKSAERSRDELLALTSSQAADMLREAREEARNIGRQAEEEADALREQVRREAYKEGLEKAAREVEALMARAQAEIDRTLEEARRQHSAMMDNLEPRIFKLALEVAEKILGYELDHNDNAFLSMLKQALGSVKSDDHVKLRVNPSEYVRFFKSREVTLHTQNGSLKAEVINDPTVGFGGCLIETESGAIDAGVDAQLDQIGRNLGLEGD